MGYMIVDRNACKDELIKASKESIFWQFTINILENDRLMIEFIGDGFYYCRRLIECFFEKICNLSSSLPDDHLRLFSDYPSKFSNDEMVQQLIEKRIEAMPSQYQSYFTKKENINCLRKNLSLGSNLFE